MVEKIHKNEDIAVVHTDSAFPKGKIKFESETTRNEESYLILILVSGIHWIYDVEKLVDWYHQL